MRRCVYCRDVLTDEDLLAAGTGTVDDHYPCGQPVALPKDGRFPHDLTLAPPGSSLEHYGGHAQRPFPPAMRSAGMGV